MAAGMPLNFQVNRSCDTVVDVKLSTIEKLKKDTLNAYILS